MSAALKDDIKSAMSGVGVTLSGDMLSKCEFLCGVAELVRFRPDLEKPAPSRTRQPRALTTLQSGHLEPQEAGEMLCLVSFVGIRRGKLNSGSVCCFLSAELAISLRSTDAHVVPARQHFFYRLAHPPI